MVFVHHIRLLFYKQAFEEMDAGIHSWGMPAFLQDFVIQFKNTLVDGTLFVWVFWILSAYVLSIRLFQAGDEAKSVLYRSFLKRYLRLFVPVTASVLLVLLLWKSGLFFNQQAAQELAKTGADPAWFNSFFNFDFGLAKLLRFVFFETYFHYDFGQSFNPVLWSIQNEFIGSLFIFALFGIIGKHRGRFFAYLGLVPVLVYLRFFELFPFLLGYALCDLDYTGGHAAFLEKLKALEKQIFSNGFLTLLAFFFLLIASKVLCLWAGVENYVIYLTQSFVILYFSLRNPLLRRFFSLRWIYGFGTLSFSFYLLHMPVICSFSAYLMLFSLSEGAKIGIVAATFCISLLISVPFYLFIDKFAIRFSNRFAQLLAKTNS